MNSKARPLNELTATEIVHAVASGKTTCEAVVASCLERIALREPELAAWAGLNPQATLAEARACDRHGNGGALRGAPFGVKDVIDTAAFATEMGSPIYAGHRPPVDAPCVALARAVGGIVLGKTVTAEFAGSAPTQTRNPHDPARTPGGSSSGSAAAVADFHVPVAYGTQTGGSVLRPASFCGVFGFKPTFGTFNPAGVKPAAESFDTIGLIARSLDDIELFTAVLTGGAPSLTPIPETPPRIGLTRTHLWDTADADTQAAIENAARRLSAARARVLEVDPPAGFEELTAARAVINAYERAHGLAHEWRTAAGQLSAQTIEACKRGFATQREDYVAALRNLDSVRARLPAIFEQVDVLLTPCVPGEAPKGHDYAGDPRFQELWTMLHTPSLTLPLHRGPNGLPVGIQLVGPRNGETVLMAAARWMWDRLDRN